MAHTEATIDRIRTDGAVKNTFHNLIQTLSTKLDSAARYGLYADDARADGYEDCAELFGRLAEQESRAIDELTRYLRDHISEL
jgi:rubrerythrin